MAQIFVVSAALRCHTKKKNVLTLVVSYTVRAPGGSRTAILGMRIAGYTIAGHHDSVRCYRKLPTQCDFSHRLLDHSLSPHRLLDWCSAARTAFAS